MAQSLANLDDESLKTYLAEKQGPLLLAFWAPWNQASLTMEPLLKEIAVDFHKKLQVARFNIDENAHTPAELGIQSIPSLVYFEGGQAITQLNGPHPKLKILEFLEKRLSNLS